MQITEVKIRKVINEKDSKLKALVSVTIDNAFVIHDMKVICVNGKHFLAMPSRKDDQGEFRDVVHPINAKAREEFEIAVLSTYFSCIIKGGQANETN